MLEAKPVPQFESPKLAKLVTKYYFLSVGQNNVITEKRKLISDSNLRNTIFPLCSYTMSWIFIHHLRRNMLSKCDTLLLLTVHSASQNKLKHSPKLRSISMLSNQVNIRKGEVINLLPQNLHKDPVHTWLYHYTYTFQNSKMIPSQWEQFTCA